MGLLTKHRLFIYFGLILCVNSAVFASREIASTKDGISVFYTSNRQGEVEPCGCQMGQIGGIDRFWTFLSKNRELGSASLFVDAGDTFFSASQVSKFRQDQEKYRSELIADAYQKMNLDFFSPGPRDLAFGWDTLSKLALRSGAVTVSTNISPKKRPEWLKTSVLTKVAGYQVAILGLGRGEDYTNESDLKAEPWEKALESELSQLKVKPDIIIVLSHLGMRLDRELALKMPKGIIVGSRSLDVTEKPVFVNNAVIVQPTIEGQVAGKLFYPVSAPARVEHRLVSLDEKYDMRNPISTLIEKYKNSVRETAISSRAPTKEEAAHPYVAKAAFCKNCHELQYNFWQGTHHASAYLVLFAKNQHFDPECIACHSLGFRESGGFSRIAYPMEGEKGEKNLPYIEVIMNRVFEGDNKTAALDSRVQPQRYRSLKKKYHEEIDKEFTAGNVEKLYVGVQCEHCHGNRHNHPAVKKPKVKVEPSACLKCHRPPNDTSFDFKKSLPKIACPLMKRPG